VVDVQVQAERMNMSKEDENIIRRCLQRFKNRAVHSAYDSWAEFVVVNKETRNRNKWGQKIKDLEDATAVLRNSYLDANTRLEIARKKAKHSKETIVTLDSVLATSKDDIDSKEEWIIKLQKQVALARVAIVRQVTAWPRSSEDMQGQLSQLDRSMAKIKLLMEQAAERKREEERMAAMELPPSTHTTPAGTPEPPEPPEPGAAAAAGEEHQRSEESAALGDASAGVGDATLAATGELEADESMLNESIAQVASQEAIGVA